jgi:hypothetical protein
MASAPRLRAPFVDPELERSKVFNPSEKAVSQNVSVSVGDKSRRNPGDAIKRFEMEKAYGFGRRRRYTRKSKKSKKTRKHRK